MLTEGFSGKYISQVKIYFNLLFEKELCPDKKIFRGHSNVLICFYRHPENCMAF